MVACDSDEARVCVVNNAGTSATAAQVACTWAALRAK
jgi:hypothetical protein